MSPYIHQVIYDGKYKYMRYEYQKESELYDLDKDPKEQDNLAKKIPSVMAMMEKKLKDWQIAHKPKHLSSEDKGASTSKLMEEQLKALGYIQ